MPPVLARPDSVKLRVSNAKLLGDHLEPVFVVEQQLFDDFYFTLGELIVACATNRRAVFYIRILAVVRYHFVFGNPAQIVGKIILLVMIEMNNEYLIGSFASDVVFGHQLMNVPVQGFTFRPDVQRTIPLDNGPFDQLS